ncbi:MAG: hypothetical protein SGI74_06445 [Oligoflexia bacterium]|nr:hypothetical protein [Oligoflexia bacterium]
MKRILLVIEDYNELLFLETLLKKVGFEVESIRNEVTLAERMLAISPDLVVATGDGHKINGVRVGKKVKKKGNHSKLLLLFPRNKLQNPDLLDAFIADAAVETPLNPRTIITSVSQLLEVDLAAIMVKFDKLSISKDSSADNLQHITGKKEKHVSTSESNHTLHPESDQLRVQKYAQFLKEAPTSNLNGFPHNKVQEELSSIRQYEKSTDLTLLEQERKNFVLKLFKK